MQVLFLKYPNKSHTAESRCCRTSQYCDIQKKPARVSEKPLTLGKVECYLKSSSLLGGLLNIFANNTIISRQRAKHASVCLLMLHIKERFCRSLSSTDEGKHSLYCADLSLSPYFIPPLPGPGQGRTRSHSHPATNSEVSGPHTEQRADPSLLPLLPGSRCFL